ncbi:MULTISPECIES: hypothetical protein [unclassified Mesorhizobium]|uniref:hypothetical protein n=1 Tax=unclassified Mesorhizobium TaxID=325217 RepID=UPI00163DD280|nr:MULTISPECIES: hypothetical protein [unclassified Mesorhizobium]
MVDVSLLHAAVVAGSHENAEAERRRFSAETCSFCAGLGLELSGVCAAPHLPAGIFSPLNGEKGLAAMAAFNFGDWRNQR